MSPAFDLDSMLARAERERVDLGAFSPEQMWKGGLAVKGVAARPDPPAVHKLPDGLRAYRLMGQPPLPHLRAIVGEDGSEGSHTIRECDLFTPSITRTSELRRGEATHILSVQSLDGVLAEFFLEAGLAGAPSVRRLSRLFLAFPWACSWKTKARRFGAPTISLNQEVLPPDQKVWLDLEIVAEPTGAHVITQTQSERLGDFAVIAPAAAVEQVAAHVQRFYATFWDEFSPGPYPGPA